MPTSSAVPLLVQLARDEDFVAAQAATTGTFPHPGLILVVFGGVEQPVAGARAGPKLKRIAVSLSALAGCGLFTT